jgi:hypothetical protein
MSPADLRMNPSQEFAADWIGFLHPASPATFADRLRGFRLGLKLAGYAEGENVAVVYRFAENQAERLPALAVETGSPAGRDDCCKRRPRFGWFDRPSDRRRNPDGCRCGGSRPEAAQCGAP